MENMDNELTILEIEDEPTVRAAVVRHLADYIPTAEEPVAAAGPRVA